MPKCLAAALAFMLLAFVPPAIGPARAQAPISPQARLDESKGVIDRVEASLTREGLTDTQLQALRADIDPVAVQMTNLAGELAPRIDAAKARLSQLGPKPEANAPAEPADVSAERSAQDKLFNDLDASAKRARVLALQATQIGEGIGARRRAVFAHALFERAPSLLSPSLWVAVVRELPADYRALMFLTVDYLTTAWHRLDTWQRLALPLLLLLLAGLYWPVWQVAVRVRSRSEAAAPTRLGKALGALRVAAATAVVPIATMLCLSGMVDFFDLPTQFNEIGRALALGVAVVAIMTGLARGLLAPKSPNWRLVPLPDYGAKTLYHVVIAVSAVVAVEKLVEAINEVIAVALPTAIATRGLGALGVVGVFLAEIRKGRKLRAAAKDFVPTAQMQQWGNILRLVAWIIVFVLSGSVVVGYIALSSFLIEQIIAIAGTLALLYILLAVADEGFGVALRPKGPLGRTLTAALGIRAETLEQFAILLSGIARLSILLAAVLLMLAPWRIESGDMLSTIEAAFFGFSVGDVRISFSAIIVAILLFAGVIGATKALQRWLEVRYLPHTKLDAGLQNSIKTSLGYVGSIVALGVGLSHVGVGFERLAIVAGGLSVGIGLGLQTVTNNFVSGLILLWERAIRVGDRITVGSEQGYVRRINVRSTEIETFDRALVVMPNSSLITGVVKNWVRNDRIGRISLPFTLPVTGDPESIRAMLIKTAKAHDVVLAIPTPQVFFVTLTETQIQLDLICYVEDVESAARVTSDLLFDIHAGFKAAGLIQPPATPVVTSPALEKLDAWLSAKMPDTKISDPEAHTAGGR